MAYKYFVAGSPLTFYSPQETFINDFSYNLDAEFTDASDSFTIKEETYFGSRAFQSVAVRINTSVDNMTGVKLGDDFKTLLFQSTHAPVKIGSLFYFDSNYWLCTNSNSLKSLVNSAQVRRCNNVLRWVNSSGSSLTEYCIIDYRISTPNNRTNVDPIMPDGTIKVFTQLSARTATIEENQRFLFGRTGAWNCFKVYGGGKMNFLNNTTTDNASARIMELALGKSQVNEDLDDLTNGIADYYKYPAPATSNIVSNIRILPVSGSIVSGSTVTFSCYLMSGNTPQANVFTFTATGAPSDHYVLTSLDGNNFSIENKEKYLDAPLTVTCTSGANSRTFDVYLRGAW